jgi:hypothetical protein
MFFVAVYEYIFSISDILDQFYSAGVKTMLNDNHKSFFGSKIISECEFDRLSALQRAEFQSEVSRK